MKTLKIIALIAEILAVLYGAYNEYAPAGAWFKNLPPGMGSAIALIAVAMIPVLCDSLTEQQNNETSKKILDALCKSGKSCAFPENEFYGLFRAQMQSATQNVDITHLGTEPPKHHHCSSQKEYFAKFRSAVKNCKAHVRRIERNSPQKQQWIDELKDEMKNIANFSLAVIDDSAPGQELAKEISVCRVDDKYAWIIALAEHNSTGGYRDILVTEPESVKLIAAYFEKRIWSQSKKIINRGKLEP